MLVFILSIFSYYYFFLVFLHLRSFCSMISSTSTSSSGISISISNAEEKTQQKPSSSDTKTRRKKVPSVRIFLSFNTCWHRWQRINFQMLKTMPNWTVEFSINLPMILFVLNATKSPSSNNSHHQTRVPCGVAAMFVFSFYSSVCWYVEWKFCEPWKLFHFGFSASTSASFRCFYSSNVECVAWFLFFRLLFSQYSFLFRSFLFSFCLCLFFPFAAADAAVVAVVVISAAAATVAVVVFCSHPLHLQFVVVVVHTVLDVWCALLRCCCCLVIPNSRSNEKYAKH